MTAPITYGTPVASLDVEARSTFLARVYQHLMGAIVLFMVFETLMFFSGLAEAMYNFLAGSGGSAWLLILGGFMVVNWFATQAAHDIMDPARQYGGLVALAAGEAVIFAPMMYFALNVADGGASDVVGAAVVTALGFGALTVIGLTTRSDLSFIRPILMWGFGLALVAIIGGALFGFNLGLWFTVAMIGLAGGSILYQTQTILRQYPAEAYVGASVQLFASVMLLFWYVLRLFMSRD